MEYSTCRSPRTWPIGHVYSFCRSKGLDLTVTVNTAWAIVLWSYTGEERIAFPSLSITDDSQKWQHCEASVDWTSKISSVLQRVQSGTKQVSTSTSTVDADPLHLQRSPLLNTVTVFKSGDPCCTTSIGGPHLTGLVCGLPEISLDCAVEFDQGVVDRKQAERLAAAFAHVMDLILSTPDKMLASVDIVSDHDKAEVYIISMTVPSPNSVPI